MLNFRHHILKLALLVMGIVESTILVMCQSLFFCVFCCCFCLVQFDSRSFNSVRHRKKISKTDMDWIKLNGLVLIQDNNLSNCAKQPCLSFNANFSSYSLAEIPPSDCLQIMVCSCAMLSNSVWLQIIFCSSTCVNETTLSSF